MSDEFHLQRFLAAQNDDFESVLAELRSGNKRGHWMWYIFPQLKGLGTSVMAEKFGIASLEEAAAYYNHPILGSRLRECAKWLLRVENKSALQIFGAIDTLKFRSSMTLFSVAAPHCSVFPRALDKYYAGRADKLTLDKLSGQSE